MNAQALHLFWAFGLSIAMLFVIGFYCLFATYNLIRALIGLEILIKAVTLLIVIAGFITNHTALAQALVITLIVVEVVIIAIAVGVVLGIRANNNSLDVRRLINLRG